MEKTKGLVTLNRELLGKLISRSDNGEIILFEYENAIVKKSLGKRTRHIRHLVNGGIKNEASTLKFLEDENISIPAPKVLYFLAGTDDPDVSILVTERIPGMRMDLLPDKDKKVVMEEVKEYVGTMQNMKRGVIGGAKTRICKLPRRVAKRIPMKRCLESSEFVEGDYTFCHGSLSQQNIMVDPETLKIVSIENWEYSGFYPREFEGNFYERVGPSNATEGEKDDVPLLLKEIEKLRKE